MAGDNDAIVAALEGDNVDVNAMSTSRDRDDAWRGFAALHHAVSKGHEASVRLLLERRADVNLKTDWSFYDHWGEDYEVSTPLSLAVERNNESMVALLLEAGANVHVEGLTRGSPISVAIRKGAEAEPILTRLLQGLGGPPPPGLMHDAAFHGLVGLLRQLLEAGASANEPRTGAYRPGDPPLWSAVVHNQVAAAALLLERGADARYQDGYKKTVLFEASSAEMVTLLVKHNANVNAEDQFSNRPIHNAVKESHRGALKTLLALGAEVAVSTCGGSTPLHRAADDGVAEDVQLLLEARAEVAAKDSKGQTPLHVAACSSAPGREEVMATLLAAGAPVGERNNAGRTALHEAVAKRLAKLVKVLKAAGSPLDTQDAEGKTPLQFAEEWEMEEVVAVLTEA